MVSIQSCHARIDLAGGRRYDIGSGSEIFSVAPAITNISTNTPSILSFVPCHLILLTFDKVLRAQYQATPVSFPCDPNNHRPVPVALQKPSPPSHFSFYHHKSYFLIPEAFDTSSFLIRPGTKHPRVYTVSPIYFLHSPVRNFPITENDCWLSAPVSTQYG
jgi:hypothetical protein